MSSSRGPSPSPYWRSSSHERRTFKEKVHSFFSFQWQQNGGPFLIILSQFFGANMNLSARLLELDDLHPMQILCARMVATVLVSFVYMRYRPVPDGPWGSRDIRPLLVLRAFSGFVGLYGMWCSIIYLPLAEATVISFLAPNLAGYLCRIFLREPFTRREQIGSYLALAGVVLITRPISLLSSSSPGAPATDAAASVVDNNNNTIIAEDVVRRGLEYVPTVAERLSGVGMGLLGVMGGAVAITSLRSIGPRAHPLISVNYFSLFCSVVSISTLAVAPVLGYGQGQEDDDDAVARGGQLRFAMPSGPRQCGLLLAVGLAGFGTQFFLAAGLSREKSNRATAMIYTHVLFAAFFDRFIFGQVMGWVSVAGCALVVGSALWVALSKGRGVDDGRAMADENGSLGRNDLESSLSSSVRVVVGVDAALPGGENVPILADVDGEDAEDLCESGDIDLGILRPQESDSISVFIETKVEGQPEFTSIYITKLPSSHSC